MSKHYRSWKIDAVQLLPASVQDYVPEDHPSRFIVALVREHLDLSEIEASYASTLGQPAFDPALMTALLLNGYASGIGSSRRIAKACRERADFMMIVAGDAPDFRTISDFRKRHLPALKALFVQVLKLCEAAGLVKLGHVAIDGSKINANASKHKAMSYGRMEARARELETEVDKWMAAAEAADAAEDKRYGRDKRGDELPAWVADKKRRAAKIRAAQAELEAEAKAAAAEETRRRAEAEEKRIAEGRKKNGFAPKPPSDAPDGKAQRNFTDPQSRIMKSKDGFVQAYNGQIAVDAQAQVIVAHDVTQSAADSGQLLGMVDAVEANLGRKPEQASADAGYCSEANLAGLEQRTIDAYVATGRARDAVVGAAPHGEAAPADAPADALADALADAATASEPSSASTTGSAQQTKAPTRVEAMRTKIASGGHASPYRLRKQVVEPVFGQIKQARGFRQFLLRGLEKVRGEWALVCTAHNLLKLAQRRSLSAAMPMPQEARLAAA
jgi:transposase